MLTNTFYFKMRPHSCQNRHLIELNSKTNAYYCEKTKIETKFVAILCVFLLLDYSKSSCILLPTMPEFCTVLCVDRWKSSSKPLVIFTLCLVKSSYSFCLSLLFFFPTFILWLHGIDFYPAVCCLCEQRTSWGERKREMEGPIFPSRRVSHSSLEGGFSCSPLTVFGQE